MPEMNPNTQWMPHNTRSPLVPAEDKQCILRNVLSYFCDQLDTAALSKCYTKRGEECVENDFELCIDAQMV